MSKLSQLKTTATKEAQAQEADTIHGIPRSKIKEVAVELDKLARRCGEDGATRPQCWYLAQCIIRAGDTIESAIGDEPLTKDACSALLDLYEAEGHGVPGGRP